MAATAYTLGPAIDPLNDGTPQAEIVRAVSQLISAHHLCHMQGAPILVLVEAQRELSRVLNGYVMEPIARKADR